MKSLHKMFVWPVLLGILFISTGVLGQDTHAKKETPLKNSIDAHRYIFKAQSVHPSRGRIVQLTSEYDVRVSRDTIKSFLPYFGRAYSAPVDPRGGGIDFTSTNFEYSQRDRRKGGWEITIRPKDVTDTRELFLVVFENGSATLRITSNNREPISFNGTVEGTK